MAYELRTIWTGKMMDLVNLFPLTLAFLLASLCWDSNMNWWSWSKKATGESASYKRLQPCVKASRWVQSKDEMDWTWFKKKELYYCRGRGEMHIPHNAHKHATMADLLQANSFGGKRSDVDICTWKKIVPESGTEKRNLWEEFIKEQQQMILQRAIRDRRSYKMKGK